MGRVGTLLVGRWAWGLLRAPLAGRLVHVTVELSHVTR
jgi:hypothetical protein